MADLRQLARLAGGHASRERFLTELTLDPPEATSDEAGPPSRDEDYLILSTIHAAKGQEWSAVYVLNAVDGCIPSDLATGRAAEIEEERRLLYVAMTRAKHDLQLIVPQRFHLSQQCPFGDKHVSASLTRFVPEAVAALFDHVAPGAQPAPRDREMEPTSDAASIDVSARVRAMWD
jgi:DNA helicase-2/ATP-dependent DNA helicase PcrA